MSLGMLNLDELIKIFSYLSAADLCKVAQVCLKWNEAASTSCLWKRHCMEKWSFCNLTSIPGERTWQTYFSTRARLDTSMESGRPGKDYSCKTLRGHTGSINDVTYVTSNDIYNNEILPGNVSPLVASCGKDVQLWNIRDGKCIYKYAHGGSTTTTGNTGDDEILFLAFDKLNSWLASADRKGDVHILDVNELKTVCVINTGNVLSAIKFGANPSHKKQNDTAVYLYTLARGGHFNLWDIKSPAKPLQTLTTGDSLFGPKGIIEINSAHCIALSSNHASTIQVFDLKKLEPEMYTYNVISPHLCTIVQANTNVTCLKWLPLKQGILVAGYSNGPILLWDTMRGGVKISSVSVIMGSTTTMEITGRYLITSSSSAILQLWDIDDEKDIKLLQSFENHIGPITGLFVDPFRAMTCSVDFSIRIYKWSKASSSDLGKTLESRYTLLGGSLQRCGQGFRKIICDFSTCVGLAENAIKAYSFKM